MYLVNFKLVASGVDSLVAEDYVDISKCSLIKVAAATVVLLIQGLDGAGGAAQDKITITMQGTTAEKQANAILVGRELALMVNRSKHVGIQHSNKMEVVGNKFMNTTGTVSSAAVTGILTITTVVAQ
mgnify:CR=1 FL=1|tara:strand:+ start:107 stop:487 length:381 start_codon:yes stop_codon:yes gene_type:complete